MKTLCAGVDAQRATLTQVDDHVEFGRGLKGIAQLQAKNHTITNSAVTVDLNLPSGSTFQGQRRVKPAVLPHGTGVGIRTCTMLGWRMSVMICFSCTAC